MRRIARLRKPTGWACATPRQSIAPLSTQCARPQTKPLFATSTRATTCASTQRFYSQKSPLPSSLIDTTEARSIEELTPEEQLEQAELAATELLDTLDSAYQLPPSHETAPSPEAISDSSYEPAVSADELSTIGGIEGWWERRENWAKSGDFAGFKAKKKIQDPQVLETAVRRAVVEAIVLREAGREDEWVSVWPVGTETELANVLAVDVQCNADGVATLAGNHAVVADSLNWEIAEAGEAEREADSVAMCSTAEAATYVESWDPSWKQISLADPAIKFAVTKRIFQLTGQLTPDHKLAEISTVSSLLSALSKPPKAKTLTDDIQQTRPDLVNLPNVAFSPKQVTRGDKAKAIGQYKIIEEEFKKRDLQDGHLAVGASKEKHWFKGSA